MAKLPYLPLYTGDWRKDPALTLCMPATRGVWIDLLCAMHDLDRSGELCGTLDELARVARCSTLDLTQALTDLQNKRAAEVRERNGVYYVRNRRMHRESEKRKANAERQIRHRALHRNSECNGGVTEESPLKYEIDVDVLFESFWKEFPEGRRTSKGRAREAFEKALGKTTAEVLIAAAKEYAASDQGQGAFVKMPSTWLNGECWTDSREAWKDRNPKAKKQDDLYL